MGAARFALVVVASLAAIACGSLLGFGSEDEIPAPPATPTDDAARGPGDPDGQTTVSIDGGASSDATGVPLDAGKLVFLSSSTALAKFDGGADGANAFCDALATAAGITGRSFVAYLFLDGLRGGAPSTTTIGPYEAWFLPNGARAFDGPFVGDPLVALDVDEHGTKIDASARAWIGTAAGGVGLFGWNTCDEWKSTNGSTRVGDPARTNAWNDDGTRPCGEARHVYCFER